MVLTLSTSLLEYTPSTRLVTPSRLTALADYYAIEPAKNKKALAQALDNYLVDAKQQFLNWFDEVEKYFNVRVEEIKQAM